MGKLPAGFFKHLKSNRGAGIVTVLVTMMLISILGSALLFASFTGYRIKISDRGGKESFYDASAAMDEIKSGVQQAVTEALSTAYTDVLSEYTTLSASGDEAIHAKFAEIFAQDLRLWETFTPEGVSLTLFESSTKYSAAALKTFLSPQPAGALVDIAKEPCTVVTDPNSQWIRLKDISVSYTTAAGYQSTVTSDILITMPDFHATTSTVVSSALPSFALIADGTLGSAAHNPVITGNAYAGKISLAANGNSLTYTGGTLVCGGAIEVENGARLRANAGTEVWAESIFLGPSAPNPAPGFYTAQLYGRTFVADDLVLSGKGSSAELRGSYFGFGSGTTADTSSAIIANGRGSTLNIENLERLILAGTGFIKTSGGESAPSRDVRTGESISAKSNQLAYLIDKSCISVSAFFDSNGNGIFDPGETAGSVTGSNPYVFTGDYISYTLNTGLPLWGTDKTLADYGITSYSRIIPVHKNLPGTGGYKMAYYYLDFASQDMANQYFRDYFSANPQRIEEYIRVYLDLSNQAGLTSSSGNTLYENSAEELKILANTSSVNVQGRSAEFSNRRQTLNPGKASPADTPFTYYVDRDAITRSKNFTLPGDSKIVAKVIRGSYTINASEPAKVIVATGDVTVSSHYSGLILSGGNVTVNGNVTYALSDVEDIIYRSADDEGKLLSSYLLNTVIGDEGSTGFISSWDLDLLVSYENWSKN